MQREFDRAVRLHQSGDLPGAEKIYREIIARSPGHGEALYMLGIAARQAGRIEDAMSCFRQAQDSDPHNAIYQMSLGTLYCETGRNSEGVASLKAARELDPKNPDVLNNLGVALIDSGAPEEAVAALQSATRLAPKSAEAHCNLAIALGMRQQFDHAVAECKQALALRPNYPKAQNTLRNIYQQRIPMWHWPMMNDLPRNAAYQAALEAQVEPGMVVLDIGSGSGLLALMAARAGASHVYSCEMDPLVAGKAREIVAQNGYADRVTIIARNSAQLEIGRDMPARADLLVTETFDARLLGEGVVPIINDARARLLKPDARVIPERARVFFQLLEGQELVGKALVGNVCGFDLSAFNEFRSTAYEAQLQLWKGWQGLTEVAQALEIEFCQPRIDHQQRVLELDVIRDGSFQVQAYWFQLDFGGGCIIDSGPYAEDSHWKQMVQIEAVAKTLAKGQQLTLDVAHNGLELMFRLRG